VTSCGEFTNEKKREGSRFAAYATTAKAPAFVFPPGLVSVVGDVPHSIVAVKWNFVPMSVDVKLWDIVGVRLAPAVIGITADCAVNPAVPVPSTPIIVIWA